MDVGLEDVGWTEEVMDEVERLMPGLVAAGYAAVDEEANTRWFTKKGVARFDEIESAKD
jgi:hypothetical protein